MLQKPEISAGLMGYKARKKTFALPTCIFIRKGWGKAGIENVRNNVEKGIRINHLLRRQQTLGHLGEMTDFLIYHLSPTDIYIFSFPIILTLPLFFILKTY